MARTVIVAQAALGSYPALPITANGADLVEVAAGAANGNSTVMVNARTLVIAHNTGVGARTITFTSVIDAQNRTGHITAYSIGAGEIAVFGQFKSVGWSSSGSLLIDASHAEVKLGIVTLAP